MSDNDLRAYSILKAYDRVHKSAKFNIKKAIPAITTLAIGTSLALTQPGRFSAKAKTGLGFLALSSLIGGAFGLVSKGIDNYYNNKKPNEDSFEKRQGLKLAGLALTGGLFVGAGLALGAKKGNMPKTKLTEFLSNEKKILAKELNISKVGKFIEKHSNGFISKYPKLNKALSVVLPFGIIGASSAANIGLTKSISKDMNKLSMDNYIKGKSAQMDARKHFDSIDAIEV